MEVRHDILGSARAGPADQADACRDGASRITRYSSACVR